MLHSRLQPRARNATHDKARGSKLYISYDLKLKMLHRLQPQAQNTAQTKTFGFKNAAQAKLSRRLRILAQ